MSVSHFGPRIQCPRCKATYDDYSAKRDCDCGCTFAIYEEPGYITVEVGRCDDHIHDEDRGITRKTRHGGWGMITFLRELFAPKASCWIDRCYVNTCNYRAVKKRSGLGVCAKHARILGADSARERAAREYMDTLEDME